MKKFSYLILALSCLLASCASTKLINSWTDKENTPQQYKNIGVTALFPNSSNRYVTEHAIVDQLKEKGLNGMSTVDVFPMATQAINSEEIMKHSEAVRKSVVTKVKENNIDALMIVTLFDMTKEQRWVNDRNFSVGGTGYYGSPFGLHGSYYDYYAYSLGTVYNSGYYVDNISYYIECNLYDVESEQLIYRAQTKSTNIKSVEEEAKALAYIVAKQLVNKKVVEK
ncbi:hypothetical protein [uncultured Draconibacterium sp.]|uniref:hypothetical protein n=1 Tax=uncultured Draconibacterium sp. TaxID=1573823 RepID=UPI0029C82D6E|nr:hypothetical protein [uncultured Draconibacterium sp.]